MSKFRIELSDSVIRRAVYAGLLTLFVISVWSWGHDALPNQWLVQILLTVVLALYFGIKLFTRLPPQVVLLDEQGRLNWLHPDSSATWQITRQSRSNRFWHWLVLEDPVLNTQKHLMLYKDSMAQDNWRHLCRIVNQVTSTTECNEESK